MQTFNAAAIITEFARGSEDRLFTARPILIFIGLSALSWGLVSGIVMAVRTLL